MKVLDIINVIEKTAPPPAAAAWDHSGIQIAAHRGEVSSLCVCLDPSPTNITKAAALGADFVLSHHPLLMQARHLDRLDDFHAVASAALTRDMWLYAAHTSLDANTDGPVAWLADELALADRLVLDPTLKRERSTFYLPGAACMHEAVSATPGLLAMRIAGHDIFATCDTASRERFVEALRNSTQAACPILPATPELDPEVLGFGIIGNLAAPLPWNVFIEKMGSLGLLTNASLCGTPPATITRVAYCTGSGSSLATRAFASGTDIFITGDVKYHAALETNGPILDVGHFSLEEEMMRRFAARLQENLPGLRVTFLSAADPLRRIDTMVHAAAQVRS